MLVATTYTAGYPIEQFKEKKYINFVDSLLPCLAEQLRLSPNGSGAFYWHLLEIEEEVFDQLVDLGQKR